MKVLDFQELKIYLTPFTPFPFVKGRAVSRIIKQEIKRVKLT
jgi:hypothetical protein